MLKVKDDALIAGTAAYVLLVLAPALLKLARVPFFVEMSWRKATILVWGPWLMGGVFWTLLGLISAGEWLVEKRQAKLKIHNDLTLPRT